MLDLIVKEGDRVELHPATDRWMRGDRFGTVVKIGRKYVHIKLERSGQTRPFTPRNVLTLDNREIGK
jgi:hypothetical protein